MLTRFRKIAYLMAYAVAAIPLWYYIHYGRILALITVVIIFAYINVVLSTVDAAQSILTSEKAKIALPRWLPNKAKYHKWWMLVRHTLKWHLLLIPAKMGLALGFVQKLHLYMLHEMPFEQVYNYYNYHYPPYSFLELSPQWETLAVAGMIITLFTIFEAIMVTAIVLKLKHSLNFSQKAAFVLVARVLLSLSLLGAAAMLESIEAVTNNYVYCPRIHSPAVSYPTLIVSDTNCVSKRMFDTTYLSLMTSLDQGVLLSANIMRPWGQVSRADFTDHDYLTFKWDNRPFVARQIVAGILGLLLYAGTTWLILWFVEDEP